MATRASTRSSRTRSSTAGGLEHSRSPCHNKRPAIAAAAGIFPRLDDETARMVVSYLPSACLGDRSEMHLGLGAQIGFV